MQNQDGKSCEAGKPDWAPSRRGWFVAAAAGVLFFAACISLQKAFTSEVISKDGTVYTKMAWQWQQDPQVVIHNYDYPPGYPVAILGMHKAMEAAGLASRPDSWDWAARAVSLIAGLAALAGLLAWGSLALNRWAALIAVLLLGVGRKWTSLSADVVSDSLAIAFQIWALVLVLITVGRLARKSGALVAPAIGAGLCAGLGYLVRPEAMLFCAIGVAMAAGLWCLRRLEWKRPALTIVLLTASAGLAAMPYFLAIGGLSKKKKLAELMGLSFCGSDGSVMLASMPVGKGLEVLFKFTSPFIESMHTIFAVMLFVWVVAMVLKRIRPSMASLYAQGPERLAGVAMMLYLGVILVVLEGLYRVHHYLDYRHTMMVALVISPLAGQGALVLAGALARAGLWLFVKSRGGDDSHRYAWWMKFVAVTGSLALAAGIVGHNLWEPLHYGKGVYRQAMAELAQTPGGAVLSDSPLVDHYLWQACPTREAKVFYSWPESAGEIHKLAIASGARYVVLPAQRKSRLVPSSELMVREGFRPWKEYVATNGDLLRVYEAPGRGAGD